MGDGLHNTHAQYIKLIKAGRCIEDMRGHAVQVVIASAVLLLLFSIPSTAALKAVIVADADENGNYTQRNNITFTHGDTLKVYAEMKNVNHDGFVFVDFVFIIKDPRDNIVSMDKMDVRRRDYDDNAFILYTKEIPNWWLYGRYELDIYSYDRADTSKIREIEEEFRETSITKIIEEGKYDYYKSFFESGSEGDVIKSYQDSKREHSTVYFRVCSKEELEALERARAPPSPPPEKLKPKFVILDVRTSEFEIEPGESVYVYVVVKNEGASGTDNVTLFVNEKKYAEAAVKLNENATITVPFELKLYEIGFYKITISGSNIVKGIYVRMGENSSSSMSDSETSTGSNETANPGASSNAERKKLPLFNATVVIFLAYLAVHLLRKVK